MVVLSSGYWVIFSRPFGDGGTYGTLESVFGTPAVDENLKPKMQMSIRGHWQAELGRDVHPKPPPPQQPRAGPFLIFQKGCVSGVHPSLSGFALYKQG